MNRVMFSHKSGRKELMELRYAKILQGLKRGTYMTRDMQAATESVERAEPVAPLEPTKPVSTISGPKKKPKNSKESQRESAE